MTTVIEVFDWEEFKKIIDGNFKRGLVVCNYSVSSDIIYWNCVFNLILPDMIFKCRMSPAQMALMSNVSLPKTYSEKIKLEDVEKVTKIMRELIEKYGGVKGTVSSLPHNEE